jgi:hypothetical protein
MSQMYIYGDRNISDYWNKLIGNFTEYLSVGTVYSTIVPRLPHILPPKVCVFLNPSMNICLFNIVILTTTLATPIFTDNYIRHLIPK